MLRIVVEHKQQVIRCRAAAVDPCRMQDRVTLKETQCSFGAVTQVGGWAGTPGGVALGILSFKIPNLTCWGNCNFPQFCILPCENKKFVFFACVAALLVWPVH